MIQKCGTHEGGQSDMPIMNHLFKKICEGQSMASMLDLVFYVIQGYFSLNSTWIDELSPRNKSQEDIMFVGPKKAARRGTGQGYTIA